MESIIIQKVSKVNNGKRDEETDIDLNNNLDPAVPDTSTFSSPLASPSPNSEILMIGPYTKGRGRTGRAFTGGSENLVAVKRFKAGWGNGDQQGFKKERELFKRQGSKGYSKVAQISTGSRSSSASLSVSSSKPKPHLDILKIINTFERLGEDQTGLNFVDFFNAGVSVSLDFNFNLEEELTKTMESGDFGWIQDAAEIDQKNLIIKRRTELQNQRW